VNGLDYETVARFAQQAGTLYFGAIFFAGLTYALWPSRRETFRRMSQLPLEDDHDELV
jgi:cytochrome c oxidase cbb3-type subunit 4